MKLGLSPEEVTAVLAQVQTVLDKGLDADVKALKKAADDKPASEMSPPSASPPASPPSAPASPPASASPAESGPPAPPSAPPMDGPPSADAPPMDGAPTDPAAEMGADASPEQLEAEYAALSDQELDMHYMAAKKALWARKGPGEETSPPMEGEAPPMEGAPPAPPSAPPSAPPMPPEMGKGEKEVSTSAASASASPMPEKPFGKAEQERMEDLQAQVVGLTKLVKNLCETPVRKGITSITQVEPKNEPEIRLPENMNPSLISSFLREKVATLSKADRDLVMKVYDGKVSVQKIAHLLK